MLRKSQFPEVNGSAVLSDDLIYRYYLKRWWGSGRKINYILLNPSTADETIDDRTVINCMHRTFHLKYDGIIITNLFAYRSTDPIMLENGKHVVGKENDKYITQGAREADLVICGWGPKGALYHRDREVLALLKSIHVEPKAVKITKNGYPQHPLYLTYNLKLQSLPQYA